MEETGTRRRFLQAMTAAPPLAALEASGAATASRPNILLIMADQLVPHLTGVYGHPVVQTPNLNRLAARGVRFDAAYSPNPLCAPARACMMTGRHSSRIGMHDNAAPLACDEPTIAHYLTSAGYHTAWSGKMHYVGADQHHGLHKRLSRDIYPADFSWTKSRDKKIPGTHARGYIASGIRVGAAVKKNVNRERDEECHEKALEYLALRAKSGEPFFLGVSYNHPHEPFWPEQEYWDLYEGKTIDVPRFPDNMEETRSAMDRWHLRHHAADQHAAQLMDPESLKVLHRAYYAQVTYVDRKAGELLDALDRLGLARTTVVLFLSDHGDMLGSRGMVQKRCFYEWSARAPMILALPDGRFSGQTVPEPVSLIDVAPTVLELAGVDRAQILPMDGASVMPLVAGRRDAGRAVFSETHSEGMYTTCFMVRRDRFKYVYIHGHPGQLFDVKEDPGEWNNLAGKPSYAAVEKELKALILSSFDPDRIEGDLRKSLAQRELILPAQNKTGRKWDFVPDPVS